MHLREPNVISDNHPLLYMKNFFTELKGATVFSSINLTSAYLQVMLHEDSLDLIVFITDKRAVSVSPGTLQLTFGTGSFYKNDGNKALSESKLVYEWTHGS